jgi:hypothetical protein
MSQSVNSPRDAPGGRCRLLTGFVHLDVMNRDTIHLNLITHTHHHIHFKIVRIVAMARWL